MGFDLDALKSDLKRHEGFKLKLYSCTAGKLTIGVGHNIEDLGLDEPVIDLQLKIDIDRAAADARKYLPSLDKLSEPRQRAIVNMAFNMGLGRLSEFKKFKAAIEAGDWGKAKTEMLNSKWARQVGERAVELSRMIEVG